MGPSSPCVVFKLSLSGMRSSVSPSLDLAGSWESDPPATDLRFQLLTYRCRKLFIIIIYIFFFCGTGCASAPLRESCCLQLGNAPFVSRYMGAEL